jgi:hypothetical protein
LRTDQTKDGRRKTNVCHIGTIIAAAIQSTNMQLGNILVALALHPDQRAELRANPALIPNMIEEAVRWDPALQGLLRIAKEDAELAGTSIPAGTSMFVSFASANRDATRFADAERFDIHRTIESAPGLWLGAAYLHWPAAGAPGAAGGFRGAAAAPGRLRAAAEARRAHPQPEPARLPDVADSLLIPARRDQLAVEYRVRDAAALRVQRQG